jgi:hypothetical protein
MRGNQQRVARFDLFRKVRGLADRITGSVRSPSVAAQPFKRPQP